MAECIAEGSVVLANQRKCPVVNKKATTFEELVFDIDTCIKEPENDTEFQAVMKSCGASALLSPSARRRSR